MPDIPPSPSPPPSLSRTSLLQVPGHVAPHNVSYFLGMFYLGAVILLWVSSSFLTNAMFTDMDYNKPFLVTYLCTATFSLYLVPVVMRWVKTGKFYEGEQDESVEPKDRPLTTRETAQLALVFCALWFIANWTLNAALGYTSVSSTTILTSMSGFFTLGIGALAGVEKFTVQRIGLVIMSTLGVIIVSKNDENAESGNKGPSRPVLGDFLAIVSAVAYALYVILVKVRVGKESRLSMPLFFGFVGLFDIVLLWPVGFLLNYTGIEHFILPDFYSHKKLYAGLFVNSAITFVSDMLYVRAMLLTSPLAVTLGISLTIPLAIAGDLIRGTPLGAHASLTLIGALFVLVSFFSNGLLDVREESRVSLSTDDADSEHSYSSERQSLIAPSPKPAYSARPPAVESPAISHSPIQIID